MAIRTRRDGPEMEPCDGVLQNCFTKKKAGRATGLFKRQDTAFSGGGVWSAFRVSFQ